MRCINADNLIMQDLGNNNYLVTAEAIVNARTFEAEPVRHGHWIRKAWHGKGGYKYLTCECGKVHKIQEPHDEEIIICSECGKINDSNFENYCPNCGAKMEAGE